MDIGIRLQAVRKSQGFSQRELAKRVGVTNSTISLIEQNKVSPSISSLKKVLDGIPISLADFFTIDFAALDDGPFCTLELRAWQRAWRSSPPSSPQETIRPGRRVPSSRKTGSQNTFLAAVCGITIRATPL